ncbi:MAG: flagellar biosynthesis anti-sigma factor FlgM [Deltaproteobacteria bacterium]|nr:flagellar biosynthesis anti-sigma factor FlgM [Deltaproteobacteria bacterium]
MKISDVKDTNAQIIQQYQRNDNMRQNSDKQVSRASVPEEKVDLSTKARDIQQIKSALAKLPEIREEKVLDLKEAIEARTYNVSGEKIAGKMVGESLLDILA